MTAKNDRYMIYTSGHNLHGPFALRRGAHDITSRRSHLYPGMSIPGCQFHIIADALALQNNYIFASVML